MELDIVRLSRMDYEKALAIQQDIFREVMEGNRPDTLLLVEHDPVVTFGIRGKSEHVLMAESALARQGVKLCKVRRGGDVTYHGPGQLVAYPVIHLRRNGLKVKDYVDGLQNILLNVLADQYGLACVKNTGHYTGVWIGERKIAAIGIEIKRGVTMHGFAFNVNTDLEHFKWIVPCGIMDKGVTSIAEELGHEVDMKAVERQVINYYCREFDAVVRKDTIWPQEESRNG